MAKTSLEVAETTKIYIRRHSSIKETAERIGVKPQTLSSQLNGQKYPSKMVARRLADIYGFNIEFLTRGEGRLKEDEDIVLPGEVRTEPAPAADGEASATPQVVVRAANSLAKEMSRLMIEYKDALEAVKVLTVLLQPGSPELREIENIIAKFEL